MSDSRQRVGGSNPERTLMTFWSYERLWNLNTCIDLLAEKENIVMVERYEGLFKKKVPFQTDISSQEARRKKMEFFRNSRNEEIPWKSNHLLMNRLLYPLSADIQTCRRLVRTKNSLARGNSAHHHLSSGNWTSFQSSAPRYSRILFYLLSMP